MTGKIEENTPGLINQDTGLINDNTGMIENSTGKIGENAGLITKTNDTKHTANGRRKRSKERGKDNKPRNFALHTMKNLPQFRNKSHEGFRQHILKTKGVDIGKNISGLQIGIIAAILFVIITSPLWVEKLVRWSIKETRN